LYVSALLKGSGIKGLCKTTLTFHFFYYAHCA